MVDRRYRALTELSELTDDELLVMALGGWHKLNTTLMCDPSLEELQRLMVLELTHARRPQIIVRLRQAISREITAIATIAASRIIEDLNNENELDENDLGCLGLTAVQVEEVINHNQKGNYNGKTENEKDVEESEGGGTG